MARTNNFLKSKTRSTFLTSLFTISLVLFFLNLFAAGAIYSHLMFQDTQENFEVMVTLPDHVAEEKRAAFGEFLAKQPFAKDIHYISKDDAGKIFEDENGKGFMEIMDGVNPLPASYNFKLKIDWITTAGVAKVQETLKSQEILQVQDITYPIEDIEQLRKNTYGFIKIGILIGGLVTLIAFFIVNSTIRLAIYGKRLMIRSMQLIGATAGFIRWPFVRLGILQGFAGAMLANGLLIGLAFALKSFKFGPGGADDQGVTIQELLTRPEFLILLGGIVIFGTLLGWLSSSWAVSRFMNKNLDQLM
jgi:cell division transport system permease protein